MVPARLTLVGFLVILIQVTVFSPLDLDGAQANIVLLFAIATALEFDAERGAVAGFCAGLAFDLLLDTPAGLSALTFAVVGWGVGVAKDAVLRSSWIISALLVALASAAGTMLYAGLAVVFGVTVDPGDLPAIVAMIAVVNAALSRPMRAACRWALGPHRDRARDRLIFR